MHSTPATLLQRLRQPDQPQAWTRFVRLYTPLLFFWARRTGLQAHEAADLVQDVFVVLVKKLPEFSYDRHQSFRSWLRTVALNQWRDRFKVRARQPIAAGAAGLDEAPAPDEVDDLAEAEDRRHLVRRALHLMQADFQPATWKACWEQVVNDRSGAEVAAELGISIGAAYAARFRVLARLREELRDLL